MLGLRGLTFVLGLCGSAMASASAAEPIRALDVSDQSAPVFTVYGSEDGLSDEIWSTIGIDRDGFVWAGSASELARFDGYGWTLWDFPQARSLVRDMERSADGTLWAMFEREGLAFYDGSAWTPYPLPGDQMFRFSDVYRPDGARELWFSSRGGLRRWDDGVWHSPPTPPAAPVPVARFEQTVRLQGRPLQWVGSSAGGLWLRDPQREDGLWQPAPWPEFRPMYINDVLRTEEYGQEQLWVSSYHGGVARISEQGVRLWRSATGELPSEAIYSIRATYSADGEQSVWLASRAGLLRIRGDQVTVYDRRHGLPSNAVRGIKVQSDVNGQDVLWLATEGGIARSVLTRSPWQTASLLGSSENGIFGLLLEPDGRGGERLWVGSAREGLALFEDGQWRYFNKTNGRFPADGVRDLWRLPGPDGRDWRLASLPEGGMLRIDDDLSVREWTVPWTDTEGQLAFAAHARRGPDGHELWFGIHRAGIYSLRGGKWQQHLAEGASRPWSVSHIVEQPSDGDRVWLWASSDQGLARYDGHRWELVAVPGLTPDSFHSLSLQQSAERTLLWLAGRRGLARVDVSDPVAPRIVDDGRLPPQPDPTIYSVLFDSQSRIYVCTNNGVQQLTPRADGGFDSRVFRRRDGLVHDECNSGAQLIDRQDRYWVGTLAGLSVFDPRIQSGNGPAQPKPLYLTSLRMDAIAYPTRSLGPYRFPAGSRELSIRYTLLAGMREDESRYRTRLHGYETDFSDWTGAHARSFSGLAPGDYRFEIEARDYAGTPSAGLAVEFSIAPHWWQRPLLQVLLIVVALCVLLALALLYNRGLRTRQQQLRLQVAERTAELQRANERLTELSYLDPLTGVANRRRLTEVIGAAIERAQAQSLPIGLIVVDVDHFKDYNDRHGHLAGDVALRAVAQALASATREQDLIARFGGEEFACLMIDADLASVAKVAERMRALVEALPPRTLGNDLQTITISVGICSRIPRAGDCAQDLLSAADAALYAAKNAGRNCVRVAAD